MEKNSTGERQPPPKLGTFPKARECLCSLYLRWSVPPPAATVRNRRGGHWTPPCHSSPELADPLGLAVAPCCFPALVPSKHCLQWLTSPAGPGAFVLLLSALCVSLLVAFATGASEWSISSYLQ